MPVAALIFAAVLAAPAQASERGERIAATWDRVFAPPPAHAWQLAAGAGWRSQTQSSGVREARLNLSLGLEHSFSERLGAWAYLQGGRTSAGTLALRYTSQSLGGAVGGGLLAWRGHFCLRVGPYVALDVTHRKLTDSGASYSGVGTEWALGAEAAAGVGIAGRGVLSLVLGAETRPWRAVAPRGGVELALAF